MASESNRRWPFAGELLANTAQYADDRPLAAAGIGGDFVQIIALQAQLDHAAVHRLQPGQQLIQLVRECGGLFRRRLVRQRALQADQAILAAKTLIPTDGALAARVMPRMLMELV